MAPLNIYTAKIKNILIELHENRIIIHTNKESDLSLTFSILKNISNRIDLAPLSLYIILEKNIKIKKSLNRFNKMNFWEFLDFKEDADEDGLFVKSGEVFLKKIVGWEVRYKINPSIDDILIISKNSIRESEEMINNLKSNINE